MAEVLVDVLDAARGVPGEFGPDTPKGAQTIEIATNRVASPDLARAFRIPGRPERASICDCMRPKAPTLLRTLFFMTDGALLARLKAGRVGSMRRGGGRRTLPGRPFVPPSRDEPRAALDHLRSGPDRASGLADVLGTPINTRLRAESPKHAFTGRG